MRNSLITGQPIDRHAIERYVVVEVHAEGSRLVFVAHVTQPPGIVLRTNGHVRITPGGALGGKRHCLGAGGRNDALELAREGPGLL